MSISASREVEIGLLNSTISALAGIDEVGRGCVMGGCTVGIAIVDHNTGAAPYGLTDSKLLSARSRERLIKPILEWVSGKVATGHASASEIDRFGINPALRIAALRALSQLPTVSLAILDGKHDWFTPPPGWQEEMVSLGVLTSTQSTPTIRTQIKADRDIAVVAAASVFAKTVRDEMMQKLDSVYPGYGLANHKGYLTLEHRVAILAKGPSPEHRISFRLPQV